VRSASSNIRRIQNQLIFAEPAQRKELIAKIKPFEDQLDSFLGGYQKWVGDSKDRELWENAKAAYTTFQREAAQIDDKILANDVAGAKGALTESDEEFDALMDDAGAWRDYNVKLADNALKHSGDTYASARTSVIVLLIVAGLLGAVLALFISRAITGGVGQM